MNFNKSLSLIFILFLILSPKTLQQQQELESLITQNQEQKSNDNKVLFQFRNNIKVNGKTEAYSIKVSELEIKQSDSKLVGGLDTKVLTNDQINTKKVTTSYISSNTGVLNIIGNVIINQKEENNNNFANTQKLNLNGDSLSVQGVKQWSMVNHDDFEGKKSLKGWSDIRTSSCKKNGNVFLGGHCQFSHTEVSKKFYINIPHTQVRVTASFHMLDNWEGEFGYMKINGRIAWIKEGKSDPVNGINYCGGEDNDAAFNLPIDAYVNHEGKEIEVTFGSTLEKDPCDASFGVDDVMIYVK